MAKNAADMKGAQSTQKKEGQESIEDAKKKLGQSETVVTKTVIFSPNILANTTFSARVLNLKQQITNLLSITDKSDECKVLQELIESYSFKETQYSGEKRFRKN